MKTKSVLHAARWLKKKTSLASAKFQDFEFSAAFSPFVVDRE
jgi:hypothetical protein